MSIYTVKTAEDKNNEYSKYILEEKNYRGYIKNKSYYKDVKYAAKNPYSYNMNKAYLYNADGDKLHIGDNEYKPLYKVSSSSGAKRRKKVGTYKKGNDIAHVVGQTLTKRAVYTVKSKAQSAIFGSNTESDDVSEQSLAHTGKLVVQNKNLVTRQYMTKSGYQKMFVRGANDSISEIASAKFAHHSHTAARTAIKIAKRKRKMQSKNLKATPKTIKSKILNSSITAARKTSVATEKIIAAIAKEFIKKSTAVATASFLLPVSAIFFSFILVISLCIMVILPADITKSETSELYGYITSLEKKKDLTTSGTTLDMDILMAYFLSKNGDISTSDLPRIAKEAKKIHSELGDSDSKNMRGNILGFFEKNKDEYFLSNAEYSDFLYYIEDPYMFQKSLGSPFVGTNWKPYISSKFGYRIRPNTDPPKKQFHAIDIAMPKKTPINAIAGGTVTTANESGSYGNCVRIETDMGGKLIKHKLVTIYAHLYSIDVKKGDIIKEGDVIGKVGSTGNSTGPHLHLEITLDGNKKINAEIVCQCDEDSSNN